MSLLNVNKIAPQSGTALTLGDSGDTFTVPSGATLTVAGTFTQTGAQTFDGGVDIDNFNINGTTIALSSGNMTIDAQGNDTDIIFKGTDGSADTTFLTIDGSAAGAATFNNAITSGAVITSGAGLVIADTGNIGSASDTDAIAIAADGDVTFSQKVGIVSAHDLGTGLHIKTADSGASVSVHADELVIEGSANSGLSILSGNSSNGRIMFGDDGDNDIGYIEYDHSANQLALGANAASHIKIDSAGHVTMPLQSAVHVKPSTAQQNVAVNAGVTVVFGTEVFDRNGDFASNTFTAPVTGLYQVNVTLEIENTDGAGDTYFAIDVIASNRSQRTTIDYNSIQNDSTIRSCTGSVLMDMDASDTITIQWYQSGGTAQADISAQSSLSIFLAC